MMITRTIALVLICASALALSPIAPLQVVGDNSDCALYLNGPGRSSAYDYSINLLKGNLGYEGQANCITYEAINQAYIEARNRILVAQPKGDWKAEDFASVGELVLDISINIARRYGLTYEEIEKGLPLIDTSRTLIREVCPPVFSHVECRAGKYRRLDGLCNNLQHPTWGATMAPFQRLIGPLFADGINAPRIAHHGRDLPLSRVVSRTMHPDDGFHDHAGTVMVIAWGQFMDHDYTLTATPLDPINRNDPEECCKRPLHLKHPYCNEIRIPDDDYFYRLFGVKCIDFVRGFPSPRPGCRLGSRVPYNTLTGAIDGNTVYGVTEKFARKLRTGFGGLLRMNPVFKEYGLKDLLPLKLDIPDEGCTRPNKNMYCFEAGEIRVNEQLVLTCMHTLMAREHNRIANALAEVNPHWDDEIIYQESRRINIAEIQHITYNEFLPILLGKDVMEKFGLVLEKEGYWDGYDPEVNPDVLASFAAAAYRFGHSLLPTAVERWSKAHKFIASKRLSDLIRRPYDLYRAGVLDEYIMGLMNQVAQAMDDSITQEVTNHLFKKVGARFGMDLVSFNMQRGREFGLPGYMEFRKFCGLPAAETFQDLFGSMPNQTVQKYETIFDHPIDVDLWSGGVSERPLPGSMLGPTFACIIATQFSYSRRGDRFWFELPNQPSSFNPEQLAEIRKSRLARVICDNTDIIDTVQLYPMVLPDHELNPRVPCRSGILPQIDFSKWAEPAPFHGSAKQFMTVADIIETNITKNEEPAEGKNNNDTIPEAPAEGKNNNETIPEAPAEGKNNNETILETPATTQSPDSILLQTQSANDSVNNSNNVDMNSTTNTDNQEKEIKSNEIINKDTLLKFVYKKGENTNDDKKTTGHIKNSLKRRKRSADPLSPLPKKFQKPALIVDYETSHSPAAKSSWSAPLDSANILKNQRLADFSIGTQHNNVDNTKHGGPEKDSSEIENLQEGSNENTEREKYKQNESDESYESDESEERKNYKKSQKYSGRDQNRAESGESDSKKGAPYLSKTANRKDSSENYDGSKSDFRSVESRESAENNDKRRYKSKEEPYVESRGIDSSRYSKPYKSYESGDSIEENRRNSRILSSEPQSSDEDSNENSHGKYRHNNKRYKTRYSHHPKHNKETYRRQSVDASPENISESSKEKYSPSSESYAPRRKNSRDHKRQSYRNDDSTEKESYLTRNNRNQLSESGNLDNNNNNSSLPIQDIDLDKFSHERIKIDANGKVESVNDNHENVDPNSAVEILSPNVIKPNTQNHDVLQLVTSIHTPSKDYSDKLVNINDGEVRPVVEIHTEQNDESSEENKKDSLNNSESLETLLGNKESQNIPSSDESGKIVANKEADSADVKQQFERIPLNYNHAQNSEKADDKNNESPNESISKVETTPKENTGTTKSDGTIDAFTPDNVRYDENLNIKFDDLHINLPEIKLPDDILAFTKAHSPFHEENNDDQNKKSRYEYDGDNDDNHRDRKNKKSNDDDDNEDDREEGPAYYRYYGGENDQKQDYKKKNNDDDDDGKEDEVDEEDEDLYEKFVRERFGKRGTFEKRSEKLEDRPLNPDLTKTLQNVLKKAADIDEQAKKSGDPNAGYMWTLEYGENL